MKIIESIRADTNDQKTALNNWKILLDICAV